MLSIVISVLFVGLVAALCAYDCVLATALTFALLPWTGLVVDVGISVDAHLLATIGLLIGATIWPSRNVLRGGREAFQGFYLLMGWAALLTLARLPFLPPMSVSGGFFRSPYIRSLLQIPMFCLTFAPLYYVRKTVASLESLEKCFRIYILSCLLMTAVGFVQVVIYYATGSDILPLGIVNRVLGGVTADANLRTGMITFQGSKVFRMSSLAGEPRMLGMHLVAACLALQLLVFGQRARPKLKSVLAYGALLTGVALTQSSSAIYAICLGWACTIWIGLANRRFYTGLRPVAMVAIVISVVALMSAVLRQNASSLSDQVQWASGLLTQRTVGRGNGIEDFDAAILDFLIDRPQYALVGVGLGNAHLYADDYLEAAYRSYAQGTVFTAKSGYLRLLSELGLVGLVFYIMAIIQVIDRRAFLDMHGGARKFSMYISQGSRFVAILAVLYCARGEILYVMTTSVAVLGVGRKLFERADGANQGRRPGGWQKTPETAVIAKQLYEITASDEPSRKRSRW